MAENAAFEVVLIEGNHEDLHRRYQLNLELRPEITANQEACNQELAALNAQLSPEDIAFLESAVPFYRLDAYNILAVHGGVPGDMTSFPVNVEEAATLRGKHRRAFSRFCARGLSMPRPEPL